MEKIGDGAAIFLGATTQAGDTLFRHGHDVFYMTGVEFPDAFLVVDGMRKEVATFTPISRSPFEGSRRWSA